MGTIKQWTAIPRALALTAAVCCAVVVVSCLPEVTPRSAFILAVSAAVFWGERLSPLPWMLAWWGGGFFGVVPHVLVALAMTFRCGRNPAVANWTVSVAIVGVWASTIFDGPTNMERVHPERADIVCLGDCSISGSGVRQGYCELLGGDNFAVPGTSPSQTVAQWQSAQQLSPRYVLWQAGPNVKGAPDGALSRALAIIAAEAKQNDAQLVVIDYPVSMWPEPKWKRQLRESVPEGALFVDPHLRWWEIDGDHLHPTAAGHRRIAEVVAGAIDAAPSREDG